MWSVLFLQVRKWSLSNMLGNLVSVKVGVWWTGNLCIPITSAKTKSGENIFLPKCCIVCPFVSSFWSLLDTHLYIHVLPLSGREGGWRFSCFLALCRGLQIPPLLQDVPVVSCHSRIASATLSRPGASCRCGSGPVAAQRCASRRSWWRRPFNWHTMFLHSLL